MQEEWVVCRVFHKNSTAKKSQPTTSSQQSDESLCDTYNTLSTNEFGDIDLPNFNLATPSIDSNTFTNISLQNYTNSHENIMNLASTSTLPLLPAAHWSSSLLSSINNNVLFRALQLGGNYYNHQPRDDQPTTIANSDYPFNIQSHFGIDVNPLEAPSSSVVFDPLQPQAEQSYKLNSNIWE